MKKIKNLEDLRYRKLYLRSKIELKERKISSQLYELRDELNTADFKNEIIKSAMNNPSTVINIARLTYDLITRIRKYKQKKRAKGKAKKP